MSLNPPTPYNDRGFLVYGGSEVPTRHGQTIRVQESSAASEPHVWMFIGGDVEVALHLSLADAIEARDRLNQFISSAPERWSGGRKFLALARKEVKERRARQRAAQEGEKT